MYYEGKICVPRQNIKEVLRLAHDSPLGGHFGFSKTLSRLDKFHWYKKNSDIKQYCDGCATCQQSKDSHQKPFGISQPLEPPDRRWGSVGTDFIVHLPVTTQGHYAIATYIDRFTKRVHFLPPHTTATAESVALDFYNHIFRLHGLPDNIVSDIDPRFTSEFWKELMRLCAVHLKMSTSHHPQTDGCSEITNRVVENFLRWFCNHNQTNWDKLLTAAEFAYNSAHIAHLHISPFELDFGWKPKSPLDLMSSSDSSVESVNDLRKRLSAAGLDARFAQRLAQARQATYINQRYRPPTYQLGDQVWLSRKYFTDSFSKTQTSRKLGVKRYVPFQITELIGKNAVRLAFPDNIKVNPVVHVEHTSIVLDQPPHLSQPRPVRPAPLPQDDGSTLIYVDKILSNRKRGAGYQWLAAKTGAPLHEAEWQPTRDFLDADGTITKALHDYIVQHNLLPHFHNIVADDNGG